MKTNILFGLVLGLLLMVSACKESTVLPIEKDGTPPDPVSNVEVESLPGGAIITYDLPESKNLLYVKAVFEIGPGNKREEKVSYYKNSLTVVGFPDTSAYEGKLYAVSRSEVESEPVTVSIKPLTPPVVSIFKSLTMQATFGGVRVNFENEAEADVVISVLASDSLGNLMPAENYYTKSKEGTFAARGFSAEPTVFAVFVRDRWDNLSDTTLKELVPLYEEKLDKTKFKEVHLATDTYEQHCCGSGISDLWDDIINHRENNFLTKPGSGMPQWFTFDLGDKYRLSRFKLHQTSRNAPYTLAAPKVFQIYGSNNPSPDGSWDSWTLLGEFESIIPSGEDSPTTEDIEYALIEGEDYEFPTPEDAPVVQYLRFRTETTWGGLDRVYMSELTFWGSKE